MRMAAVGLALALGLASGSLAEAQTPPKKVNNPVDYQGNGYDRTISNALEEQRQLDAQDKAMWADAGKVSGIWPKYRFHIIGGGLAFLVLLRWLFK